MVSTAVKSSVDAFHVTDPKFDFWSASHSIALDRLKATLEDPAPLSIFTGDPGAGKSTVVRQAVAIVESDNPIGLLSYNDDLWPDFKCTILKTLGVDKAQAEGNFEADAFFGALRSIKAGRGCPMLILDDAHRLDFDKLLDFLRDARIGLQDEPVLKILLVGLDELQDTLNSPYSRVKGPAFRLDPMSEEDTALYINDRISKGGYKSQFFTDNALATVFEISGGNPQKINTVCADALRKAEEQGVRKIGSKLLDACARPSSNTLGKPKADAGLSSGHAPPSERENQSPALTPNDRGSAERGDTLPKSEVIVLNRATLARADRQKLLSERSTIGRAEDSTAAGFDAGRQQTERRDSKFVVPEVLDRQHKFRRSPVPSPTDRAPSQRDSDHGTTQSAPKANGSTSGTRIESVVAFCGGKSEATPTFSRGTGSDTGTGTGIRNSNTPMTDGTRGAFGDGIMPRDVPDSADPAISPQMQPRAGVGAARATVAAALALGVLAIGWVAIEPEFGSNAPPDNALASNAGGVAEGGTAGSDSGLMLAARVDDETQPEDPTSTQLEVIEDVAVNAYFQQGAASPEGGISASGTGRIEHVRAALGESAGGPEEMFRLALRIPGSEADAVATAYSLAALSGHDRAAYYLGQMYELGEGVPRNLGIALAWYELGARSMAGAQARSEALAEQTSEGSVLAPIPLFHRALEGQQLEMVWTVAPEAAGGTFTIEFGDEQGQTLSAMLGHSLPALRSNLPPDASKWRVGASTDDTGIQFSEWVDIE